MGAKAFLQKMKSPKTTPLNLYLFILCSIAAVLPLWAGEFLPLTDLPQHIAQVSLIRNFSTDPSISGSFELNFFNPYATFTLLSAALAWIFPVMVAVKIILSATIILFPASLYFLFARSDGDPAWSFIGFPLAYGANFFWGHLPFLFAVPIAFLSWGLAFEYRTAPSWDRAIKLGCGLVVLFFSHAVAFAVGWIVAALILLGKNGAIQRGVMGGLAPSAVVCLAWLSMSEQGSDGHGSILWRAGWHRLVELPQLLQGFPGDNVGTSAVVISLLLFFLLFRPRLKPAFISALPFFFILGVCLMGPLRLYAHFFSQRLAVFLVPCALLAFFPSPISSHAKKGAVMGIIAIFLVWIGVFTQRVVLFNREAAGFRDVLANMRPGRRTAGLILDKQSSVTSYLPYVHFAAYYQALMGGMFEHSFANYFQQVVIYKQGHGISAEEYNASWEQLMDNPAYDYYLIRLPANAVLRQRADRILKAKAGQWLLLERKL